MDDSEGAQVRPAIQDCSLLLQRNCRDSCKEKAKVIDPPAKSLRSLGCGAKSRFLGCLRLGLSISIDRHDVAMRELVRFIECNP